MPTTFDPRTISTPVFEVLSQLRESTPDDSKKKEQKNQVIELYTYLATWGLMRLKAEEKALQKSQPEKQKVVIKFFECLEKLSGTENLAFVVQLFI